MINEVLFMETRLFRAFCEKFKMPASSVNRIFNSYGIWDYIESCYDVLHMNGDEYILNDILSILKAKGAAV